MMISVDVDIDLNDYLDDKDVEQLARDRGLLDCLPVRIEALEVYEELRRGVIGQKTRDYIFAECGRIL